MKKLFVAALAAMALFASCAKDDPNNNRAEEGVETSMGLTLSFPSSTGTRAEVDDNATADEMQVNDITVFLYGLDGAAAPGNMKNLTLADFTQHPDNTWTLNHESRIVTTTGVKSVYVGVNLKGTGFMTGVTSTTNESKMNEFYQTSVSELIAMNSISKLPTAAFRMFSKEVERPALVAETDPNWTKTNIVVVNVERQVAKMTADFGSGKTASTLTQWEIAPAGSGNYYGQHTMNGYYLGQAGKKEMYRYSQYNLDGKRLTTTELSNLGFTKYYRQLNASTIKLNATPSITPGANVRTSFFGIENVPMNNMRKETTVAVFWSSFVPANATVYKEPTEPTSDPRAGWEDVTWDPAKIAPTATLINDDATTRTVNVEPGSFWAVKMNDGGYRFFYSQVDATKFCNDFNIDGYSQPSLKGGTLYQKGYTYFYKYLGNEATDIYEFARNQYYRLTVEGFNGLGYPGTLEPQDPTTDPEYPDPNPTDPIPPGEPDPTVPDPDEPTPGNEDETSLRVIVNILPWDLKVMPGLILSK